MWENVKIFVGRVDDLCWKIWQFLYKNFTFFTRKSDNFCRKIWRFLQENFDDFCKKILTLFVGKFCQFSNGMLIIFIEKFNSIHQKIWLFLQENLTSSAGKSDDSLMRIVMKNMWTNWNLEKIRGATFLLFRL